MAGKARAEERVRATVRARIRDSRAEREICVIDLSTRGLLATAARPPQRGEIIEVMIGRNRLTGQVRWSSARRFGVSLRERVSVSALAEGGQRNAELQRSVGVAQRRTGMIEALRLNPQIWGRAGELAALALLAAVAAYLIFSFTSEGFAPVQQAVTKMNG